MKIWEQAFSKQQEGNKDQIVMDSMNKQPDQQELLLGNSVVPQEEKTESGSYEAIYYQNAAEQPKYNTDRIPEHQSTAFPKHTKSRFAPRFPADKLSIPYPDTIARMHDQLSDIWANILVETRQSVEVMLVCGATRNEGCTFLSFNLSMFLSKEYNMKVLYVDSNFNHKSIPNIQNLPGLYSFVAENTDIASLIIETEYPGLFLLPSGSRKIANNVGSNLLSREPIEILMKYCRSNYDITIIDGQPLTSSPVMIEFARLVDLTALVCRYGYSRREVSKLAIDKLQKFGISSIGVILNDRRFPIPQKLYKLMG